MAPPGASLQGGRAPEPDLWLEAHPGASEGAPLVNLGVLAVSPVVLGLAFVVLAMLFGAMMWGLPVYFQHQRIQVLEERVVLQRDLLRFQEQACTSGMLAASKCEALLRSVQARLGVGGGESSTPP